mgnify:CR=1 FL=1
MSFQQGGAHTQQRGNRGRQTTSSRNIPEAQVLLLRGLTGRGAPFFRSTRKVVKAGYELHPHTIGGGEGGEGKRALGHT